MKFNERNLKKAVQEVAAKALKTKLRNAGVSGVTVTPRNIPGKMAVSVKGPASQVEKARKKLGGK